jgi:NAD(P)-dependent dehydrogenase (short-subunit alcohol dehydrogenase family)
MMDPADKVTLVSGAASEIGLAIFKELLQNKVKVINFYIMVKKRMSTLWCS